MVKKKITVGSKKYYKSKTFWANVLLLLGAIISALFGEYTTSGVLTVPAIVNIILRMWTKYPVEF